MAAETDLVSDLDDAMSKKPGHGLPCNGCGGCCMELLCVLGRHIFDQEDGPCPALESCGQRYECGLTLKPREFAPVRAAIHGAREMSRAASILIGVGIGCDAQAEGEPANVTFLADMHFERLTSRDKMLRAAKLWGINEE